MAYAVNETGIIVRRAKLLRADVPHETRVPQGRGGLSVLRAHRARAGRAAVLVEGRADTKFNDFSGHHFCAEHPEPFIKTNYIFNRALLNVTF